MYHGQHILNIYNLVSLTWAYSCDTITTIKVINTFINSKSFLVLLVFCAKNTT